MNRLALAFVALVPFVRTLPAEDLGGGKAGGHGRVPRFVMTSWIPGTASELRFVDLNAGTGLTAVILSTQRTNVVLPGIGTLIADLGAPGAIVLAMGTTLSLGTLPNQLAGATLYIQGIAVDPGTGLLLTDATRVDLFRPVVMVGNQRQTANSLSVVDLTSRTVVQTLTDSENGSIAFSRNRRYAYVCEPGSLRNRVAVYDLATTPITARPPIPVSGGIRYQPTIAPDGLRMYVPVHDGVAVIDTDPNSASFHTELLKIPVPITGAAGSIFEGPFDCAVTPDGRKLVVCYGERVPVYTSPGTLGVIDLTNPGYPHTAIPITNSGALTLLGTPLIARQRVDVSADGRFAYVVEFAFKPGMFTQGFQNGGAVNVVNLITNTETSVITFGGYGVHEMCIDRNNRNLWIAANDVTDIGRVTRIDVDRRSATLHTILASIPVDPVPYPAGGAFGICTTPDGATVCVSLAEDGSHAVPVMITIDARTDLPFGAPIPVQSLPATVGVQQF